ncbi:MAG: LPS export ABC transporter periplasmic protein LptC [Flavobacteriales bacterium]
MILSGSRTSFLSILLFAGGMLFSCTQNEIEEIKALTKKEEVPFRTSRGVELTYIDSGQKEMKLFAERMDQFREEDGASRVEFHDGFRVLFYDGDTIGSELKAREGTLYGSENRMVARNDVVVTEPGGERLNTEKLIWDRDSGKVFTDQFVKITREDGVVQGNGLVAESDLSSYRIQEITGEWYFEKPKAKENEKEAQ